MLCDKTLRSIAITRINDTTSTEVRDDVVAVEEPLEIRVMGRPVAVVMRTPGHDRELAAGFLVTERLLRTQGDLLDMVRCGTTDEGSSRPGEGGASEENQENVLDVILTPGTTVDWGALTRHVFTSSSCGLCSKATIEAVQGQFAPLSAPAVLRRRILTGLPAQLRAAQPTFDATGGLHASALFDASGRLVVVREDVGRHNALDKVIGQAFFAERLPLAQNILLVSGRVSFEIMQKALAAGIPVVAAISAPTSAAVEFARASGQGLVGFLRGERMNVYAGTLSE